MRHHADPGYHQNPQETRDISPQSLENGSALLQDGDGGPELAAATAAEAISVNSGSDSEMARAETPKMDDEGKGHARSGSIVKKPTSFKAVSVNKTFLAARPGSVSSPSPKLGERTLSSSAPSASATPVVMKPRLVAKSGSGMREASIRAVAAANGVKPGAAPDASAVWNKNRRRCHVRRCSVRY